MLYIKEIYFKIFFFFFSFLILIFILYLFQDLLLFLITLPFIFLKNEIYSVKYFIYTHPVELTHVFIQIIFLFSFLYLIPYILWSLFDFFKTCLYKKEVKLFKKFSINFFIYFFFVNLVTFIFFLPKLWIFFISFNNITSFSQISFELKISDYFNFIYNYLLIINLCLLILLAIFIFIININFLYLIKYKKFILFINILLATILSTPEIISQLSIFFSFSVFTEILFFILLLKHKFNTVIN